MPLDLGFVVKSRLDFVVKIRLDLDFVVKIRLDLDFVATRPLDLDFRRLDIAMYEDPSRHCYEDTRLLQAEIKHKKPPLRSTLYQKRGFLPLISAATPCPVLTSSFQ
eukprot:2327461-Rhodomonas_salina.1